MNNVETNLIDCTVPYNPELMNDENDWDDNNWNDPLCIEHVKENYIKNIRQDLVNFQTYCPVDDMARAIGGAFTGEFVKEICQESEGPIKYFERHGKCYVQIEAFLEKFKDGLTFEDGISDL